MVGSVSRSGWLQKRSGGLWPRWQARYAQLSSGVLYLRHSPTSGKCRTIRITSVSVASREIAVGGEDGAHMQLRCASLGECQQWAQSLQGHLAAPNPPSGQTTPPPQQPPLHAPANTTSLQPAASPPGAHTERRGAAQREAIEMSQVPLEPPMALVARPGREMRTQSYVAGDYSGEFLQGERHGVGRFDYRNGNLYTGAWEHDRKHGFGMLRWSCGDTYTGEWRDNQMCGFGLFHYANGNTYNGQFLADCKHGHGRFLWANGDVYDGEWARDTMAGSGTIAYKNGNVYIGECKANVKHGKGRMKWASGDIYDGEWAAGLLHGRGAFWYADGGHYDGEWRHDRRHGSGAMTHPNNDVYDGSWQDDMRQGHGKCEYANGDKYVGDFVGNLRHGYGVYTAGAAAGGSAGDEYSGYWLDDVKHGHGKYVWADGDVYEGDWERDKRNADGECSYSNGDLYVGQWQDDLRHGWGRLVWADGNTYEGGWKNDNISPGSLGLVKGRVLSRFESSAPSRRERENSAAVSSRPQSGGCSPRFATPGVGYTLFEVPGLQSDGQSDAGSVAGSMVSQQLSLFSAVGGPGSVLDNVNMAVGGLFEALNPAREQEGEQQTDKHPLTEQGENGGKSRLQMHLF